MSEYTIDIQKALQGAISEAIEEAKQRIVEEETERATIRVRERLVELVSTATVELSLRTRDWVNDIEIVTRLSRRASDDAGG